MPKVQLKCLKFNSALIEAWKLTLGTPNSRHSEFHKKLETWNLKLET